MAYKMTRYTDTGSVLEEKFLHVADDDKAMEVAETIFNVSKSVVVLDSVKFGNGKFVIKLKEQAVHGGHGVSNLRTFTMIESV